MSELKYGHRRGGTTSTPVSVTDAESIKQQSGRFVTRNTSTGAMEIADTSDDLFGWLEFGGDDSSTSGIDANMIIDPTAIYRIPLIYDNNTYTVNYSEALIGETCDLKVDSGVQYAHPEGVSNNSLIIWGGQAATGTTITAADGWLDVQINPNAQHQLAVGA